MREREDQEWVFKWEEDLPAPEDLMPITQNLITPDLAAAFKIPQQQSVDSPCFPGSLNKSLEISLGNSHTTLGQYHSRQGGMDSQQQQQKRIELEEEESSVGATNTATTTNGDGGLSGGGGGGGSTGGGGSGGEEPARTLKRPRLVWTPQLHKRFVDAVAQLGIKNAVPKTIMQLMNVEGLTRENVASHLQKYRLYLKRMQGFSSEGPSSCDHLFASTPVPPSHFLPREDVVMPLVPMLGHGHLVAPPQAQISRHPHHAHHHLNPHYAGFDPRFLAGAIPRQQQMNSIVSQQQHQRIGSAASVINREFVVDDLVPTSSPPPRQVLTLFPTSGGDN